MTDHLPARACASSSLQLCSLSERGGWPRARERARCGQPWLLFEEDNFDPKFSGGTTQMRLGIPIYDYPTTASNDKPRSCPGCVELDESGRAVYTFHLRPNVKFQNGDPVTSADVKFSITRQMEKDSKNTIAGTLRGMIAAIETPSPSTVVLRLNEPDPELLLNLSPYLGGAPVVPANYMNRVGVDAFRASPDRERPLESGQSRTGLEDRVRTRPRTLAVAAAVLEIDSACRSRRIERIAMLERGEADIAEIGVGRGRPVQGQEPARDDDSARHADRRALLRSLGGSEGADGRHSRSESAWRTPSTRMPSSKASCWGRGSDRCPGDLSRSDVRRRVPAVAEAVVLRSGAGSKACSRSRLRARLRVSSVLFGDAERRVVSRRRSPTSWPTTGSRWASTCRSCRSSSARSASMYRGRDPKINGTATVFRYPAVFDVAFNCQDRGVVRVNVATAARRQASTSSASRR